MMNIYLLSILSIQLYIYGHIIEPNDIVQQQRVCSELDLAKYIEFPYDQKCVQIGLNLKHQSGCLSKLLASDNIPVRIRSHTSIRSRDISTEQQDQCQTFIIFAETIDIVKQIFKTDQSNGKQFFPFTKIYFYFLENHPSYTTDVGSMILANKFLMENALFGYVLHIASDGSGLRVLVKDLLTNEMKKSVASNTPKDLLHPIVDTNLMKEKFRISLFNCKPFTIYPENQDDET